MKTRSNSLVRTQPRTQSLGRYRRPTARSRRRARCKARRRVLSRYGEEEQRRRWPVAASDATEPISSQALSRDCSFNTLPAGTEKIKTFAYSGDRLPTRVSNGPECIVGTTQAEQLQLGHACERESTNSGCRGSGSITAATHSGSAPYSLRTLPSWVRAQSLASMPSSELSKT